MLGSEYESGQPRRRWAAFGHDPALGLMVAVTASVGLWIVAVVTVIHFFAGR